MQPRHYDTSGRIDYTAIEAHARQLRDDAIDAFWSGLVQRAEALFAKWRRSARAHVGASAIAQR